MANLLQNGAAWLGTQMKSAAGRTVKIRQGESEYESVTGWHALQDYNVLDEEGYAKLVRSCDWRFSNSDLPTGFEFRPGDRLIEGEDDERHVFEVMPLAGQPCWEFADSSGVLIIIHTKQVS